MTAVQDIADNIADSYMSRVKTLRYSPDAQRALRMHGNMAARLRKALAEYAADPSARANNVEAMKGQSGSRMRVGDYRIIFQETGTEILVSKIGPRGSVYE